MANSLSGKLFGGKYKKTLYFVPCADKKPKVGHKISEFVFFRFLLNEETLEKFSEADEVEIAKMLEILKDIDKQSEITQVEVYRSSMHSTTDAMKAYHVFIVFKTTSKTDGDYWWSLEKNTEYIVLQRSRNKENVKDKLIGEQRTRVKLIKEDLKGKGTIKNLFEILWAHQIIKKKYHLWKSNCQFLVTFVCQQITEIGYEFKGNFKYSPPRESGRDKQMLDLILILRVCSDWPLLFNLIQMGNTDLVDKTVASGNYDINACNNEHKLTPLHFAIMLEKTEMVKHLLQPPLSADPTRRDAYGRSALQLAALFTMKTEIFDLLLEHDKVDVDNVNELGRRTALHLAASVSNVVAVRKLIEIGANPNIIDEWGLFPLHVAAIGERDADEIIHLLLAHPEVNVDDVDGDGQTALYLAACASNVVAVQKLLERGANPNLFDKNKMSPLHVAAMKRDGIPVIDLLLEAQKVKGMGDGNNANKQGMTALHWAALASNEIKAEHLIKNGANVNCRANIGLTPLHYAALGAKDMNIIDLLLLHVEEEDIQQYRNDKTLLLSAEKNLRGLGNTILDRLVEKGIEPTISKTDKCSLETDKIVKEEEFDTNGRDQDGPTLLLVAIATNNVNAVRRLLERGADPTIPDEDGNTPFHLAAGIDRDSEILKLLLDSGKVDINEITPKYGKTAFHIAIATSNVTAARLLLSNGADPNVADENGFTPLHWAAEYAKDMDIVELLLNHPDVDVYCLDNLRRNALYYAKENKEGTGERIVNLLKEKGVVETENTKKHNMRVFIISDVIEKCVNDATVPIGDKITRISESKEYLLSAIQKSNVEIVRLLLKNGAGIRTWSEKGENTLHLASRYAETTELIDVILETGDFDINGVDSNGNTPLHCAIWGNNFELNVRHLLEKGADHTVANKDGSTPLHMAVYHIKSIETVSLLLENKQVDINRRDKNGSTALHYAIDAMRREQSNNVEMVRYLLKKGADPTIRDEDGYTPFHLSTIFLTNTDVLGLMLENENKMYIDAKNKKGETALHLAIYKSNVTAVRLLLSNGANPNVADQHGETPLHWAVHHAEDMDIVDLLLNHPDVNVNYLDNNGHSALAYAMSNEHGLGVAIAVQIGNRVGQVSPAALYRVIVDSDAESVRLLLTNGAHVTALTWGKFGANALHVASLKAKTTDVIDAILETGKFNINGVDNNGRTPLHYAINRPEPITINARHLIKMGADPGIADKNGVSPLHIAARNAESMDLIELLLNNEAVDVNCVDNEGRTALSYARDNEHGLCEKIIARLTETTTE